MPEWLWKNWPQNVLAYSWFPVAALLLVELCVASRDVASVCCEQVTHPCSAPACGSALVPVNRRTSCEKHTLLWDSFRLERVWEELGAGWWAGFLTSLHPGIRFWYFWCWFSWFVFCKCEVWLVGPVQCLPVSHTHWVEKHSPRPRWISWENWIFSCSCRYWYHTAVLKRLYCCSCFTFSLGIKGILFVIQIYSTSWKTAWKHESIGGFGDLLAITVHKGKDYCLTIQLVSFACQCEFLATAWKPELLKDRLIWMKS